MIGIIKKKITQSNLSSSWNRAKDNKRVMLCTMIFDVLFLAALFLTNRFLDSTFPGIFGIPVPSVWGLLESTAIMLAGFTLITLIYSFFKLVVMCRLRSIFEKSRVSMKGFLSFFALNLKLIGIYLVVFIIIAAMFTFSIAMPVITTVGNVFMAVVGLFLYLSINTAHSLFFQEEKKRVVINSCSLVFNRFRDYIGIIIFTTATFFILTGAYYLTDWAILSILGEAISTPVVYLGYAIINTLILFTLGFGLLAFNRVYFYIITLNSKKFITKKQ